MCERGCHDLYVDPHAHAQGRGKKGMTEESLAQFEQAVAVLNQQGGVKVPACLLAYMRHTCTDCCS